MTKRKLKDKVWKWFSLYIRWKNTDEYDLCTCVTCGVRKHPKEMQAGHFLDGRSNAVLFEEKGVHPQCYPCNVGKHGNKEEYYPFMLETYGQGVIDELKKKKRKGRDISLSELEMLHDHYKEKAEYYMKRVD